MDTEPAIPDLVNVFANIQGSEWLVLAGMLLTLLVWLLRRFTQMGKIPVRYVPLFTALAGAVLASVDGIFGQRTWYEALTAGLLVSAGSGGFWSMFGKYLLPLPNVKTKD